jgi:hypothetical protein
MNEFHIDDYLTNPDWNFPPQIDYSIHQSQFVELSNIHHNIPLSNEINSNSLNLPPPSPAMVYDLQLQQNSSSNLRLTKYS